MTFVLINVFDEKETEKYWSPFNITGFVLYGQQHSLERPWEMLASQSTD